MPHPSFRINLKTLMVAVAIAGWISFNCRLLNDVMSRGGGPPAAGEGGRIFLFSVLGWVVGSLAGCAIFARCWLGSPKARRSVVRGFISGGEAGFCAWWLAMVFICIGYREGGQMAIGAIVMGAVGATINGLSVRAPGIGVRVAQTSPRSSGGLRTRSK